MALSKNTPIKEVLGDYEDLPLYQAIHAYEGSMIFDRADGYATTVAGGLVFRGHADAEADNASGASAAKNVRVRRGNYRLQATLSGVALTDQGKDVYASDDGTLTLTATGNSRVGKVARYVTTNTCIVEFQAGVGGDVANHEHTAGTDGGALTSPRVITGINDTNGNELLKVTATGSAINEFTLANAAAGSGPSLTATGGDTNIPATLAGKGTGKVALGQATSIGVQLAADQPILDSSENELVKFTKAVDAVNELTIANAATGAGPSLSATGETNVPITLKGKGTGKVVLGQATSIGVQLAADQPILDSSENELLKFVKTATAVNELTVTNAATGNPPTLTATGGDTNIGITIDPKGAGVLQLGSADSLLGFFGQTGAVQQNHIANASGDDATAVNAILVVLETFGLVKSS